PRPAGIAGTGGHGGWWGPWLVGRCAPPGPGARSAASRPSRQGRAVQGQVPYGILQCWWVVVLLPRGASPQAALPSGAGHAATRPALSMCCAERPPSAGPLLAFPLPLPPALPGPRQAKGDPGGCHHLYEACPASGGMLYEATLQVVRRAERVS